MTGADRAWANHYEIGDLVRYARGSNAAGIEAGSYAIVTAVNPSANLLTVEKQSGELAIYDPRRLSGVSVYREVAHEFAVGDRIQFTAPDKSLGVANRDLAFIESITSDGRIAARLDDNRQIEFNAAEHRHFDHGYAVTSHSSQGLTAERVLIQADTTVHPDLLSSRFGYPRFARIPSSTRALWLLALKFAPAMLTKKPIVLQTEGLGKKPFHGRIVLLVNRHTASAAEMIVAFARENKLATIIGEKTAGRLLSATSVKIGKGFRLALPTGAYYTWKGSILEGTPIEPDELSEFDWLSRQISKDQQLDYAMDHIPSVTVTKPVPQ